MESQLAEVECRKKVGAGEKEKKTRITKNKSEGLRENRMWNWVFLWVHVKHLRGKNQRFFNVS